jgi:phenylpyruvate tautomerase PptA (4-oxalocrotonate tautomerase family)
MAQVKVFGLRSHLAPITAQVSDVVHACVVEALDYPQDKRFHRFFPLEKSEFFYPPSRSEKYTIVEIAMFEGRTVEAKKALIRLIIERFGTQLGIPADDVEITIAETPRHTWGFRGLPGDEHDLGYRVDV